MLCEGVEGRRAVRAGPEALRQALWAGTRTEVQGSLWVLGWGLRARGRG